ncbi:hypothetical protein [Kingella oralis]|jgi:hypothetical protein|uniref:hypothetical protein n=1 Tax=Kingella oralis TaxID=505 RepID=UPI003C6F1BE3
MKLRRHNAPQRNFGCAVFLIHTGVYIMKKSALLAVLAAIALSACSSFGAKDKAAESNASEVTAPAAETPAAQ